MRSFLSEAAAEASQTPSRLGGPRAGDGVPPGLAGSGHGRGLGGVSSIRRLGESVATSDLCTASWSCAVLGVQG